MSPLPPLLLLTVCLVCSAGGYPVLLMSRSEVLAGCPLGCHCRRNLTVDCSRLGLSAIPHIPPATKVLILDGNQVARLDRPRAAWATLRMPQLEELWLRGNQIRDVDERSLQYLLPQLRLLDLRDNPLSCACTDAQSNTQAQGGGRMRHPGSRTVCPALALSGVLVLTDADCQWRGRTRRHARWGNFCSSKPCLHGGTCRPTGRGRGFCLCLPDYGGDRCEWRQGDHLSLTVTEATGYSVTLRWTVTEEVKEFKVHWTEEQSSTPDRPQQHLWLNGTARQCEIADLQPRVTYEMCVAAFRASPRTRMPSQLIEEVCLNQRSDPVQPTVSNGRPDLPAGPHWPTQYQDEDDDDHTTALAMAVFGSIVSVCLCLIILVGALYVGQQRGFRLVRPQGLARHRQRRSSPVILMHNPTYGTTEPPEPEAGDQGGTSNPGEDATDNSPPLTEEGSRGQCPRGSISSSAAGGIESEQLPGSGSTESGENESDTAAGNEATICEPDVENTKRTSGSSLSNASAREVIEC